MSIASGYGPNWTTAEGRAVELQRRVVELEQQLAAARAEAREWQRVATEQAQIHADDTSRLEAENQRLRAEVRDVLANLDAPDDMDVISAAHFVAGSLSTAEEALEAAQAEARGLRAELARVRELAAKWRAAPQNPDEPLLAMAADELEAALSQAAEQHDPLAVSDRCGECGEPEPECVCDERESRPLTFTQGVLCSLSILDGYGDSIAYREVANPHDLNQLWEEADEFDREHLARHGYRPTPAAQESGDAD